MSITPNDEVDPGLAGDDLMSSVVGSSDFRPSCQLPGRTGMPGGSWQWQHIM